MFNHIKSNCNLLLLDLDGTLVGHSGQMTHTIQDALLRLKAQRPDIHLVVCTGRPYGGIAQSISELISSPSTPHIFHGGALVRSKDTILHAEPLAKDVLLNLLKTHSQHPEFTLEFYSPSTIYVQHNSSLAQQHARLINMTNTTTDLHELIAQESIIKAQWILHKDLLPSLRPHYLDSCYQAEATSDVMPDAAFVTITSLHAHKGAAVQRIPALLPGTSLDRAIAIGDSTGDIPMLDAVKFPFAMQNSPPNLLQAYPNLGHIDDDGVMPLIEHLIALPPLSQ